MSELLYALNVGVNTEVKELSNNEIQVTWNDGQCLEIISKDQAIELGLIKEDIKNEVVFFLDNKQFNNITTSEFKNAVNELLKNKPAQKQVKFGLIFPNRNSRIEFLKQCNEDYRTNLSSCADNKEILTFRTNLTISIFENKNVMKRVNTLINISNNK